MTVAGTTTCLPKRHLGSAIVTIVDTASPCSPLKLIRADQQPALSGSTATAGLFRVTEPVTSPNKAWVSRLGLDINKRHSAWSTLLITADFGLDKWNVHTKVTFTRHWLVQISHSVSLPSKKAHLSSNEHLLLYYPDRLKVRPAPSASSQTLALLHTGFALLLPNSK